MPLTYSILKSSTQFTRFVLARDKLPTSNLADQILRRLGYIQYTPKEKSTLIITAYINQNQPQFPVALISIILSFYHIVTVPLPKPLTEKQFHIKYSIDQHNNNPIWIHSGQACSVTNTLENEPNQYALYMMKQNKYHNLSHHRHEKLIYILQQCRDCKNIVNLKDFCITDFRTYQIVERADVDLGNDLFDIILKRQSFTERDAIRIVKGIVNGLKYLHSMQYVHGNVTPDNLRYYGDDIKLDNFKSVGDCCNDDGLITNVPYKCHILYAAPEIIELSKKKHNVDVIDFDEDIWLQIKDESGYNMSADIWSLGVIIYTILCGYPPFIGMKHEFINTYNYHRKYEIFDMIKNEKLEFHKGSNWDFVSNDAKDLLRKMLVVDKKKRLNAEKILEHRWMVNGDKRLSFCDKRREFGNEYKKQLESWQAVRNGHHFKLSILS